MTYFQDGDSSSPEDLEHSPSRSEAMLQGKEASRAFFKAQVLAMLNGFKSNMESVREQGSKLKGRKREIKASFLA